MDWDDLVFLAKSCFAATPWGLRHVGSGVAAAKECAEGFTGDALAIACVNYLIDRSEQPNHSAKALMAIIHGTVPQNQRASLCSRFDAAVGRFLSDSLMRDLREDTYSKAATVGAAVDALAAKDGPALILAAFSGGGYDVAAYYGLGKYGKRAVARTDVLAMLQLDGKDIAGFKVPRDGAMDANAARAIAQAGADALYAKVVATLQTQRKKSGDTSEAKPEQKSDALGSTKA